MGQKVSPTGFRLGITAVSYTHLSSEEQRRIDDLLDDGSLVTAHTPVSYTHRDVYKRQGLYEGWFVLA